MVFLLVAFFSPPLTDDPQKRTNSDRLSFGGIPKMVGALSRKGRATAQGSAHSPLDAAGVILQSPLESRAPSFTLGGSVAPTLSPLRFGGCPTKHGPSPKISPFFQGRRELLELCSVVQWHQFFFLLLGGCPAKQCGSLNN